MKTIVHRSDSRGKADHGWLKSHHSFSFAGYHDPQKMGFGRLRVLNDDVVRGGMGFSTHPHSNMQIVSIPLSGSLRHRDNMGNTTVIKTNEVQIMSAGTGVEHSEFNHSQSETVNFLQLWIFPKVEDIEPRYHQKLFAHHEQLNKWQVVVSPNGKGIWINQDAFISRSYLTKGNDLEYKRQQEGNGMYLFVIEGELLVNEQVLKSRDAMGVWETDQLLVSASDDSQLLVIEVPMK